MIIGMFNKAVRVAIVLALIPLAVQLARIVIEYLADAQF